MRMTHTWSFIHLFYTRMFADMHCVLLLRLAGRWVILNLPAGIFTDVYCFKECIKKFHMLKIPTKRLFLCMTSGWELQSFYIRRCLKPARDLFLLSNSGARIPLCHRLLIEVSQQGEEHRGRAKRKGKMLERKKNYRLLFFLECFQILKLALYTNNFAMRVIPICIIWNNVG